MGRPRKDNGENAANAPDDDLLNSQNDSGTGGEQAEHGAEQGNAAGSADTQPPDENEHAGPAKTDGTPPPPPGPPPPNPPQEGKRRIRHTGMKNSKVIAGADVVEFDADGIAELDADQAEYLLGIPGYKEVEGNA